MSPCLKFDFALENDPFPFISPYLAQQTRQDVGKTHSELRILSRTAGAPDALQEAVLLGEAVEGVV
jgi:hypothetical protein